MPTIARMIVDSDHCILIVRPWDDECERGEKGDNLCRLFIIQSKVTIEEIVITTITIVNCKEIVLEELMPH